MAKTHNGDCVDIDPFIPTGQCALCKDVPLDTTVPEERPGGEAYVPAPPTPEEAAESLPEDAGEPAQDDYTEEASSTPEEPLEEPNPEALIEPEQPLIEAISFDPGNGE